MSKSQSLKDKSESLADKMNKLTASLVQNLDTAEEMVVTGDDILEFVEEKTDDISLYEEGPNIKLAAEIINLDNMVQDFKFVRETLKENTENGRRVLNSITLDLLDSDDDKRAALVLSFAELNKAVADNMRLYIQSYKEISNVLLNLDRIKKAEKVDGAKQKDATDVTPISTLDLIKKISGK